MAPAVAGRDPLGPVLGVEEDLPREDDALLGSGEELVTLDREQRSGVHLERQLLVLHFADDRVGIERLGHLYHEGGYVDRPAQQWQAFNARYSSYRNLRFHFDGRYGESFRYYILWTVFHDVELEVVETSGFVFENDVERY